MKRPARLQMAPRWLATFRGNSVVRGYAKWFGVDPACAVRELTLLGVELDPRYLAALATTRMSSKNRPITERAPDAIPDGYGVEWDDDFAYIAGFSSEGTPFGVRWDEMLDAD